MYSSLSQLEAKHKTFLQHYYRTAINGTNPTQSIRNIIAQILQVDSKLISDWFRTRRIAERSGLITTTSDKETLPPVTDISQLISSRQLSEFIQQVEWKSEQGVQIPRKRKTISSSIDDDQESQASSSLSNVVAPFRFTDQQKMILSSTFREYPLLGTASFRKDSNGKAKIAMLCMQLGSGVSRKQIIRWLSTRQTQLASMLWPHEDLLSRDIIFLKRRVLEYLSTQILPYVVNDPGRLYEKNGLLGFLWRKYMPYDLIDYIDKDTHHTIVSSKVKDMCNNPGRWNHNIFRVLLAVIFKSIQNTFFTTKLISELCINNSTIVSWELDEFSKDSFIRAAQESILSRNVLDIFTHLPLLKDTKFETIHLMLINDESRDATMDMLERLIVLSELSSICTDKILNAVGTICENILQKHTISANKVFSVIFHELHLDIKLWYQTFCVDVGESNAIHIGYLLLRIVELHAELFTSFLQMCGVDSSRIIGFFCHLRPVVERHFQGYRRRIISSDMVDHSNIELSSQSNLQNWSRESLLKKLKLTQHIL